MIELTKLNKKKFILNCELIETIEETPDTIITLRNGKIYIVTESPEQVVKQTILYKQMLFSGLISPGQFKQGAGGDLAEPPQE